MEEERGMDMGPVEVDRPEPVLRATGGSEEPLSISDTGERTWVYCWEEAMAFEKKDLLSVWPLSGDHKLLGRDKDPALWH